jgi:hypothetical protein
MRRIAGALVITAVLSGCYNLKYYDSAVPGPGETHKVWVHGFVAGLVTVGEMDLHGECPKGVYKMRSNHNFPQVLLSVITSGIYTPMNVVYTCGSGPPTP